MHEVYLSPSALLRAEHARGVDSCQKVLQEGARLPIRVVIRDDNEIRADIQQLVREARVKKPCRAGGRGNVRILAV